MRYSETRLSTPDAVELFLRHYECDDADAATPTLVIVHGMSEYGKRYEHFADIMVEQGWNVVAADQRGHGLSGGIPTHVDRFSQFLEDLDQIWEHYQLEPQRTAVLGHSFGALVAARFAETRPDRLKALVLMSPLLAIKVVINPLTIVIGRLISWVVPTVRYQSRVDASHTTRSPEILAARLKDPLMRTSMTAGLYFEMKSALSRVWRDAHQVHVPILAMQGALDQVVDPEAVEPWLAKVSSSDVTFTMLDEHLHELLNEPDWPETAAVIADWLNQQMAATPTNSNIPANSAKPAPVNEA